MEISGEWTDCFGKIAVYNSYVCAGSHMHSVFISKNVFSQITIVRKRFVEGIFLIIAYNLFYIAMSRYGVTGFLAEFLLPLISFTIFVSVLMEEQ